MSTKKPIYQDVTLEPGRRLRDVICPQCKQAFRLTYDDDPDIPRTMAFSGDQDYGIWYAQIVCPHCDYEEEL